MLQTPLNRRSWATVCLMIPLLSLLLTTAAGLGVLLAMALATVR